MPECAVCDREDLDEVICNTCYLKLVAKINELETRIAQLDGCACDCGDCPECHERQLRQSPIPNP